MTPEERRRANQKQMADLEAKVEQLSADGGWTGTPLTDERRQEYERVKAKLEREEPEYVRQRFAMLEAEADKHFVAIAGWSCRPEELALRLAAAQATATPTTKQEWQRLVAECPELYSDVALRNGNGHL